MLSLQNTARGGTSLVVLVPCSVSPCGDSGCGPQPRLRLWGEKMPGNSGNFVAQGKRDLGVTWSPEVLLGPFGSGVGDARGSLVLAGPGVLGIGIKLRRFPKRLPPAGGFLGSRRGLCCWGTPKRCVRRAASQRQAELGAARKGALCATGTTSPLLWEHRTPPFPLPDTPLHPCTRCCHQLSPLGRRSHPQSSILVQPAGAGGPCSPRPHLSRLEAFRAEPRGGWRW